jgi:hypothetical protein
MTVQDIAWWGFAVIALILLGFAALVLWKLFWDGRSLDGLILEPLAPGQLGPAKASLSRFQFLIFTFVIAGLFLLLSIEAGTFVEIPGNVLGLLGISGGTYVIAKTVGSSERKQEAALDGAAAAAQRKRRREAAAPTPGENL